jgi:UDP-N-acetylglucosamine diphosphorylase / glucose-1-phosphate thymidylyltransferase / UDP-N-acetylgalactosamine diphosphorylase / glucosamine-1-phosphate N-acetyltransferase / galactosamine-1-phosphate N-acetyltransferase
MQAVILAAGNGIRFLPLSETKPKPLFSIFGKTILEYNLDELDGLVEEAIIIVGYKKEMIIEKIGKKYGSMKISYIEDNKIEGTGSAAKLAYSHLKDRFLLLNGDDFYAREDIKKAIDRFPSILVKEHENPSCFGVIDEEEGYAKNIIEKPENPPSKLVNAALYCLSKDIFEYKIEKSVRGEYEFTDYIKKFINEKKLHVCEASFWAPASYPWDIFNAIPYLFGKQKKEKKGKIEKGAVLNGEVIVKEGTVIKSGVYIEGPVYIGKDCIIGPNCFLRAGTVIEDGCRIGQAVEVKNSLVGKGTFASHLAYIGDSIIGENCNFGAGTITANFRHDKQSIKTTVKDQLIDTKRVKFGTVMGDNVKTGIHTIIYPGRKIWSGKTTLPGEKVEKDIN